MLVLMARRELYVPLLLLSLRLVGSWHHSIHRGVDVQLLVTIHVVRGTEGYSSRLTRILALAWLLR